MLATMPPAGSSGSNVPGWVTKSKGKDSNRPVATYKVSLFGESSVGKTSILHRHTQGEYVANRLSTVGFDFVSLPMSIDGLPLCLKVWDTAGQERFRTLSLQYYRGSKGLFLVYSFDSRRSFSCIRDWLQLVEKDGLSPLREVMFIVGNKSDLPESQKEVTVAEGEEFAREHHCRHFVTSAKSGDGLADLFQTMLLDLKDSFGPHKVGESMKNAHASTVAVEDSRNQHGSTVCRRISSFQLHDNGCGSASESKTSKSGCCSVA